MKITEEGKRRKKRILNRRVKNSASKNDSNIRRKGKPSKKGYKRPFQNAWRILAYTPTPNSSLKNRVSETLNNTSMIKKGNLKHLQLSSKFQVWPLKKMEIGTITLGCVQTVSDFELLICLPGKISGRVPVTKISDEYTSVVEQFLRGEVEEIINLKQLFHCGQLVIAKVEEFAESGVLLSLNPRDVNSILSRIDLQQNLVLAASVLSVQELGYVMNCGLPGIVAFLKRKDLSTNESIVVGQLVNCFITEFSYTEEYGIPTANIQIKPITMENVKNKFVHQHISEVIVPQIKPSMTGKGPRRQEVFTYDENRKIHKILQDVKSYNALKIGQLYTVKVCEVYERGLNVQELVSGTYGKIPAEQLTDWCEMENLAKATYITGSHLKAYCLQSSSNILFTISPTFEKYFEDIEREKQVAEVKKGSIVPSRVAAIHLKKIVVNIPVPGRERGELYSVIYDEYMDWPALPLRINQTVMVQITKRLDCVSSHSDSQGTCCLVRTWDECLNNENGVMLLENYLKTHERIHSLKKSYGHPLGNLHIGKQVEGIVEEVSNAGAVLHLSNGAVAEVEPYHFEGMVLKEKDEVKGTVLFVDIVNDCVEVSLRADICKLFSSLAPRHIKLYEKMNIQILIAKSVFCLGVYTRRNGNSWFVYIPSRWHVNNMQSSPFFKLGCFGEVVTVSKKNGVAVAIPQEVESKRKKISSQNGEGCSVWSEDKCENIGEKYYEEKSSENENERALPTIEKKMKISRKGVEKSSAGEQSKRTTIDSETIEIEGQPHSHSKKGKKQSSVSDGSLEVEHIAPTDSRLVSKKKKKSKSVFKENCIKGDNSTSCELSDAPKKCLNVQAGFLWDATLDQLPVVLKQKKEESSSEDEEIHVESNIKRKKRLSVAEERELARLEEEQIRKTEERLMNAEANPQSADDFDRLVMSFPNNSQIWMKYMAYHLEATEIVKARAVAQLALKTISFREEQEKLNIWVALLNLENLFGTNESLEQILQEAVKLNDPFKVHMQVLNMFSSTKKIEELDKLVHLVTKKYKHEKNIWIQAGTAYIKCGELEKSRQFMQKALNVLDKKFHVEVLSRYASLENEFGDLERAETIMENILSSYPKRTDVWMVYIDMLVKSKKLDLARQVLDRAVIQKLPPSKMKSLFKKYIQFEQYYGSSEGVVRVREMAKKYVEMSS